MYRLFAYRRILANIEHISGKNLRIMGADRGMHISIISSIFLCISEVLILDTGSISAKRRYAKNVTIYVNNMIDIIWGNMVPDLGEFGTSSDEREAD